MPILRVQSFVSPIPHDAVAIDFPLDHVIYEAHMLRRESSWQHEVHSNRAIRGRRSFRLAPRADDSGCLMLLCSCAILHVDELNSARVFDEE